MLGCFFGLAIDTLVLMVLLKLINEEDLDFKTGFIIALVASMGVGLLSGAGVLGFTFAAIAVSGVDPTDETALAQSSLVSIAPFIGLLVGAALGALALGAALSKMFGIEIKRAFLIGTLFTVAHFGQGIVFRLIFGT